MEFVVLHPAAFFQNLTAAWPNVLKTGVFAEPFPTTTGLSRVDYRDVAEVAAIGLIEDRLNFGTFELCASGLLNRNDIAATMSEVARREIRAEEVSFEEWTEKTRIPFDERQKQLLKQMFEYFAVHGLAGNSLVLRTILGREPRNLKSFIRELAQTPG
jgi:uncharacterized protein YbjT (DUF2867 family)